MLTMRKPIALKCFNDYTNIKWMIPIVFRDSKSRYHFFYHDTYRYVGFQVYPDFTSMQVLIARCFENPPSDGRTD
jgi:hypothetical protein